MGMNHPPRTAWMRLCTFRAEGLEPDDALPAGEFIARLWREATADDQIQHIRVLPGSHLGHAWLDIGVLLMADSDDRAYAVGARIITAALAASPVTFGWTVHSLRSHTA
jgi:hypothetical protein